MEQKTLVSFGFKVSDVGKNDITYSKIVDEADGVVYEVHEIVIDFKNKTIKCTQRFHNDNSLRYDPLEIPIDVLEWAIDILYAREVVIKYE